MTLNLGSSAPIDLTDQDDTRPSYLSVLSEAQYNAVTADPDEPLQILAGPGSGKTRVLVSRVAWLILENKISPRDMVVVTFTNKAANEMKERLLKLIGKERTDNLVLGTFHATCARYLRRHSTKIGIKNNFSICDVDEQKRFFKQLAKDDESIRSKLTNMGMSTSNFPGFALNEISKAKAKNLDARGYIARNKELVAEARGKKAYTDVKKYELMGHVYLEYETHLREINSLDFDDLMMFGLRLFSEHGKVIANLRHVLVDEFQDTNIIQYDLMSCLAGKTGSRGSVSIVGDPDQSIYGWRSAEVGNLETMAREFAMWTKTGKVRRAFLEENYRSTGSILQVAKAVIDGSSTRIDRNLFTSHQEGPNVILKKPEDEVEEAALIATEIKRLIACSGGLYNFDDFAILLRFNALSRNVETQLSQGGIPTRILGGARFFDRKEVKDLLAYMALADNPEYVPALNRVINVPKRKIGDKTVENLKLMAKERGMSIMALIQLIAGGKSIPGIQGAVRNQLIKFAEIINEIRQMGIEGRPANEILNAVIKQVNYEAYLKQEPDYEQRWENVKELINFSHIVMRSIGMATDSKTYDDEVDLIYARDDEEEEDNTQPKSLLAEINKLSSNQLPIPDKNNSSPESKKRAYEDTQASVKSSPNNSKSSSSKKTKPSTFSIRRNIAKNDFIDLLSSSSDEEPLANLSKQNINSAKDEETFVKDLITIDDEDIGEKSPLRIFLEACSLSTDMQEKEEENAAQAPKVTISTVHAAKGLEFPVVFVISVEDSTFPFYRSKNSQEELDEENRLLYVAITRAQTLCYLTHVKKRAVFGNGEYRELSPFISRIADSKDYKDGRWIDKGTGSGNLPPEGGGFEVKSFLTRSVQKGNFSKHRPQLSVEVISTFAKILNRSVPPEDRIKKLTNAFDGSEIAKSIKEMDKKGRITKINKGAQATPLHLPSNSSFQYASGRPVNSSFGANDFTKKQINKFDSGAFTNGWASNAGAAAAPAFTSAASLLSATQSESKTLQITNQNVSQNSKGPKLVSTSTKRLGMGRGPLKPPVQRKDK